jgi:hypothetical protein
MNAAHIEGACRNLARQSVGVGRGPSALALSRIAAVGDSYCEREGNIFIMSNILALHVHEPAMWLYWIVKL